MRAARIALVVCLLASAPSVQAQPDDQPHQLAASFLDEIHADEMFDKILDAMRSTEITLMQRSGVTERQATGIVDQILVPAFRAHVPGLRSRFGDILAEDFTVPELRAIVRNEHNEARRSAAAKAGQLQQQFAKAGQAWGSGVAQEAFQQNKAKLHELGLDDSNGDAK